MTPITLLQPARIVFGNGCAHSCVDLLAPTLAPAVLVGHYGLSRFRATEVLRLRFPTFDTNYIAMWAA